MSSASEKEPTHGRNLEDCPSVMTVDQLLEAVPLGRCLIYEKLRTGEIPNRRVGKRYLVLRDQVIAWLRNDEAAVAEGQEAASNEGGTRERLRRL